MTSEEKYILYDFLEDELFDLLQNEYYAVVPNTEIDFDSKLSSVSAKSAIAWVVDWKRSEMGEWYWRAMNEAWLEYLNGLQRGEAFEFITEGDVSR